MMKLFPGYMQVLKIDCESCHQGADGTLTERQEQSSEADLSLKKFLLNSVALALAALNSIVIMSHRMLLQIAVICQGFPVYLQGRVLILYVCYKTSW